MRVAFVLLAALAIAAVSGERRLQQITAAQNYKPVTITANSAPYDIIATPITPNAPYSQAAYQCNVSGDTRFPGGGTFPLTVKVPAGQRVRVIFANGNLNGATVTQQGEPGVIVQQGGAVIVNQAGYASPIIQSYGSVVQQPQAPPSAYIVQQGPTIIQQNVYYPQAPTVYQPPPSNPPASPPPPVTPPPPPPPPPPTPPSPAPPTPAPAPPKPAPPKPEPPMPVPPKPEPPAPTPPKPAPPTPAPPTPAPPTPAPPTPAPPPPPTTPPPPPPPTTPPPPPPPTTPPPPPPPTTPPPPPPPVTPPPPPPAGRKLLQETVPGGPNNGLVEYVALASANTVPGFVVPNTQFGVPYVEFTASSAAAGQTATFKGVLEVAVVIGGVPQYPFRPNPRLSPECQVNVNFQVA